MNNKDKITSEDSNFLKSNKTIFNKNKYKMIVPKGILSPDINIQIKPNNIVI